MWSLIKLGTWRGIFSIDLKITEETAEEAAQIVNSKRNFSINPTMAKETAQESAQRVNAKRLAAKERKTAQLDENPPGQRESKCIKTENDSDDDWVWDFDLDKVINAYQILVKKQRFGNMHFIVTLKNKEEKENRKKKMVKKLKKKIKGKN